jgi:hypothetical protein
MNLVPKIERSGQDAAKCAAKNSENVSVSVSKEAEKAFKWVENPPRETFF